MVDDARPDGVSGPQYCLGGVSRMVSPSFSAQLNTSVPTRWAARRIPAAGMWSRLEKLEL